jgi:NADH:ubiquinone oxidoreductase subunit
MFSNRHIKDSKQTAIDIETFMKNILTPNEWRLYIADVDLELINNRYILYQPQVTFGILPTHFHSLVCHYLQGNSKEELDLSKLFVREWHKNDMKQVCIKVDNALESLSLKKVRHCIV